MSEAESEVDYETEARASGWVPEDEFKGDNPPAEFVDAKTFIERGHERAGLLKKKVERVEDKVRNLETANTQLQEFYEKSLKKERESRAVEIAALKAEREQAISEGDGKAVTHTEDKIRALEEEPPPQTQQYDPEAQAWLDANPWYQNNKDEKFLDMAAFADGWAPRLDAMGFTGKALYNELDRRLRQKFPEQEKTATVEGGKGSQQRQTTQTYDDLPAADKAQCDFFVKTIKGFTKDKFLAEYDWD